MDYLISIPDQLAPHLRSLRKARGMSQVELAARLEVTQSRVAAIERNPAAVSIGQLIRILGILDAGLVLRDTTPSQANRVPPKGEW